MTMPAPTPSPMWALSAPFRALINPLAVYSTIPAGGATWLVALGMLLLGMLIGKSADLLAGTPPAEVGRNLAFYLLSLHLNALVLHALARFLFGARVRLTQTLTLVYIAYFFLALNVLPVIGERGLFMLLVLVQLLFGIRYLYACGWARAVGGLVALMLASVLSQLVLANTLFRDSGLLPVAEPAATGEITQHQHSDLPPESDLPPAQP